MPAITILASFDKPIPIRTEPIAKNHDAHVSGPSTLTSEAPRLGLRLHDFFAHLSANLIHGHLKGSYLATWEETRTVRVEADVSDAASPQLINPVDLALAANHPKEIFHLNQEFIKSSISASARADKS